MRVMLVIMLLILPTVAHAKALLEQPDVAVYYDEAFAAQAQGVAKMYPQARAHIEQALGLKVDFRPQVVLVTKREEFAMASGGARITAFADSARGVMVIDYHAVGKAPFTMKGVLMHELCHLALARHIDGPGALPRWLNEGVCQWASDGLGEYLIDATADDLPAAVMQDRLWPLGQLSEGFPGGQREFSLAYLQSKSFIEFVAKERGGESIRKLLALMASGQPLNAAFMEATGLELEAMEARHLAYLKRTHGWRTWLGQNLMEVLFVLAGLLLAAGFVRVLWRMKTYKDEEEAAERGEPWQIADVSAAPRQFYPLLWYHFSHSTTIYLECRGLDAQGLERLGIFIQEGEYLPGGAGLVDRLSGAQQMRLTFSRDTLEALASMELLRASAVYLYEYDQPVLSWRGAFDGASPIELEAAMSGPRVRAFAEALGGANEMRGIDA